MFACSQAAAPTINPRTKAPYKRGGAYNVKEKSSSRDAVKCEKAVESARVAAEKAAKDRCEVVRLQSEVARLTSALATSQASIELAKKTAMLEASQAASEKMLQRYRDGLRDGASLTRGGIGSLNSAPSAVGSTPDSAAGEGGASSPAFNFGFA